MNILEKTKYSISMLYGEKKPKVVPNVLNPYYFSKLIATTNPNDGYDQEPYYLWNI